MVLPSIVQRAAHALFLTFFAATCYAGGEEDQRNYINKWKDEAVRQMVLHRIPASITLAQGLLESGSGKSELSGRSNNHFGIKCHKDWEGGRTYYDDDAKGECFRVYDDARDSFEDHSLFLLRKRYASLFELKMDDYKGWARGLKRCGYATSPTYAKALIELVDRHGLDQYDQEGLAWLKRGEVPERPDTDLADVADPKGSGPSTSDSDGEPATKTIRMGSGRNSGFTENDVAWVQVSAGETLKTVADQLGMAVWQLKKYNDFETADSKTTFDEDLQLFTQPKRRRGVRNWHVAKEGETLKTVSDAEAVKLKVLMKRTGLQADTPLKQGQRIPLRFAPTDDGGLPWYAGKSERR
ncbi:glucosaminidase domain-containing protein [Flavobacteriales bacterium]|nr:glucosaminidase domain-containing protein [Flavobacteriales bacterium]